MQVRRLTNGTARQLINQLYKLILYQLKYSVKEYGRECINKAQLWF
jgi:hypothetical protein